jgi:hypothetical protein
MEWGEHPSYLAIVMSMSHIQLTVQTQSLTVNYHVNIPIFIPNQYRYFLPAVCPTVLLANDTDSISRLTARTVTVKRM